MRLVITSLSGSEVAILEAAQGSWGLEDILESLPRQSVLLQQRLWFGGAELRRGATLANLGVANGDRLTLVRSRRICVLVASGRSAQLCCGESGRQLVAYVGHKADVKSVALSADEEQAWVLTEALDWTVKLWGSASGKCLRSWRKVSSAAFAHGGREVCTSSSNGVSFHCTATGACLRSFTVGVGNRALVSPCGHVLTYGWKTDPLLWHPAAEQQPRTLLQPMVRSASFSPDGQRLLLFSGTYATLWCLDGECLARLEGQAIFSADSRHILSATEAGAKLSCAADGKLLFSLDFEEGTSAVTGLACAPDGTKFLACFRQDGRCWIKVWCAATGACLAQLGPSDEKLQEPCFSPDGQQVLVVANHFGFGCARLWSACSGGEVKTLLAENTDGDANSVRNAAFSPDGRLLLTRNRSGCPRLWCAASGQCLGLVACEGEVHCTVFSS